MFEQLIRVHKEKDRINKELRRRRNAEIKDIKSNSIFRAKLQSDLDIIATLLLDDSIDSIEVETEAEYATKLDLAMFSSEMAEYNVVKNGTTYSISNKEVVF